MQWTRGKKVAAAVAAGAITLAGGGVAFAYFTSTGNGTGSASARSNTAVTLTGITVTNLAPGITKSVPYTFTNTAGNGVQTFGTVSVVIGAITPAPTKTCSASDFDLSTSASASVVGTVVDGGTVTPSTAQEPTITMSDNGGNQDGCQGASVALTLNVAQGS